MNNPLIEGTLHFSESYFEGKEIAEQEMEHGRFFIKNIFNNNPDYEINDSNFNYGQLIKIVALSNRYPRCNHALEYIMEGFQNFIHANWSSYYNLIFASPNFGGIASEDPLEIVSQIKFNRQHYNNLQPEEQQECNDLNVLVKEIILVISLINQQWRLKMPLWYNAQNIYNLFNKFDILFHDLFGFHITHTQYNTSLDLYRKIRNSIAHSNFIIQENEIKLVEWTRNGHAIDIIDIDLNEITEEMRILCTIICQVMALYQLMQQ